jgi:Periplasmic binding protein
MASSGTNRLMRGWRRFQRRSLRVRATVAVVAVMAVAAIAFGVADSASTNSPASGVVPPSEIAAVDQASTSTVGLTATSIRVAFPVTNLDALASSLGFETDVEYTEQQKAIDLFVDQINDAGGINGRKIDPVIVNYDPTNDVGMRALCKQWTEGSGAVFAVLDGVGTWSGDNQLCITQEGHTPMLAQWTTVTNWTQLGAPYLWWTGPDDAGILQATVDWALSAGLIGPNRKLGIIAGDRSSDQLALNEFLLPDLKRAGVTAVVEPIAADPTESAETQSDAPLVVEKLRSQGITTVLPLIPFNVFFPILSAETSQEYFPKLLLSDYESSIESALGLIPVPFTKALNGQEGVTTETLGGIDDDRPEAAGGYDPGDRACFETWHKAYPQIPKGNQSFYIEEQGPIQGWCTEIRLFAQAAQMAGRNLNRRTFVEAMSRISNFPGGYSPVLSYGSNRYSGPSQYRVVSLHVNVPPTDACKMPKNHVPQVVCWVVMQNWKPLPDAG